MKGIIEMKRGAGSVLAAALLAPCLLLTGCGQQPAQPSQPAQKSSAVTAAQERQNAVATTSSTDTQNKASDDEVRSATSGDTIDLTKMSSTVVYGTVYQMTNDPTSFAGKKLKARGTYSSSHDDKTGNDYQFVLIADTAACCQQGLEFIWGNGKHAFPADYPAEGTEIEVAGTFESYNENGATYWHIADADMRAV